MKLYLAGPMGGYYNFNATAFDQAAKAIRKKGHEVVSPIELDRQDGLSDLGGGDWQVTPQQRAWFLHRDFRVLLECEGIALLDGWEDSVGANLELLVAITVDMPRFRFHSRNSTLRPSGSVMPQVYLVQSHLHDVAGLVRL